MPAVPVLLALVAWCLVVGSLSAQTAPGDLAADRFLQRETRLVHARFLDGAKSLTEWQERLPRLRREYLDMLGLWPLPERTPLKATVTGTLTRDSVVIEKLHYQSKPGLYVTANLYRPKSITGKLPAVLYVCGHSGRGRDGNKTAFQDHGMWFARHGYVCLVVDTLQLGEIAGKHHGTYMLNRWWWHSLAYTPAGVECWNGIRGIDYLVSRPDVDPARIGVTGISGGGATTVWVAAADERVKVAVPVSGMSDLPSYVGNRVVNGHCDCMFVVNLHRWEWTTLAALIAPRPLLFANSDNDPIFPMDGNRRIIARLREVYSLHGKPNLVAEHVSPGGHDYRPDLRIAIFRFFDEHLRGEKRSIKDAEDAPLPGEQLRAFATDADLPRDALNASIDETFLPRGQLTLPEKARFAAWRTEQLARLRQGPFKHLGEVKPATRLPSSSGGEIEGGQWHAGLIVPEPEVRASLFSSVQHKPADTRTLVILSEGEGPFHRYPDWAARAATGEIHLLAPRGINSTAWTRKNPPNTVERSYALLGKTVDLGRVHDILATRKLLDPTGKGSWRIVGRGQAGILAAYAALFDSAFTEVIAVDPPTSHRDGPHFLGILRHLDIPDALGLLAPRKLTLQGTRGQAFERTAALYRLAGADRQLTLTPASASRIDPEGVAAPLLLASEASPAIFARFVELAGGKKARLLVVAGHGSEKEWTTRFAPAEVRLHRPGTGLPEWKGVTGLWLDTLPPGAVSPTSLPIALGCAGPAIAALSGLIPDAVVSRSDQARVPLSGQVGIEIGPGAALVVQGRELRVAGSGKVTIRLAPGPGRPARTIDLAGTQVEDLTALRRAARDRHEHFPPREVRAPVVPRGTLVIVGGGGLPSGLLERFVTLAGGKQAKIVVLPTAVPPMPMLRDRLPEVLRKLGAQVTVLPGITREVVESAEYQQALREATGIWFGGGRQWRFVDAYEGTALLPLMHDVLKRGGVIGGSSAGATIQGDYLCRGGVFTNFDPAYEGYERGFAFLPGVAIDQHFAQRKRFADMTALMKLFPQYLGIGLDEATAILVQGSTAEVVGKHQVHFYDASRPPQKGKPDHVSLGAGQRYDLLARRLLADIKEK